jgi:phage shock protein C
MIYLKEQKMSERKILGVCAWIADKFGLDITGVRILFVAATVLGLGSPVLVYLILYLIKPSGY